MKDRFYSDPVVLKEGSDAFVVQGGGKIGVIIELKWGHEIKEILNKLEELHVEKTKIPIVMFSLK